jgi:signal transduction histidine kinase
MVASDNGKGFDPRRRAEGHFGIQGMEERAAAIGGKFSLGSRPGEGTEIQVVVPLAEGK